MSLKVEIDSSDIEALERAMLEAEDDMVGELKKATNKALKVAQDWLGKYPTKPSFLPGVEWWTDKQRKWFFANLRAGTLPQGRTGNLRRGWTTNVKKEIRPVSSNIFGSIENTVPYAPYVQDARQQHRMHRGNWQTIQELEPQRGTIIMQQYRAALKDLAKKIKTRVRSG